MKKTKNVFSSLLGACTYLAWSCACLLLQAQESRANLTIGFQFADGGTNKVVPLLGGTYTVNIVASTDNPTTYNLGVTTGYLGALSTVLNGSSIEADITASAIALNGLKGLGSNSGMLSDLNHDGHIDLGQSNGTFKDTTTWMRFSTGSPTAALLGASRGVIGTFTVTISPNSGGGLDFLRYSPQLDPSGVGTDWSWTEDNTNNPYSILSGSITGFPGNSPLVVGSSITFTADPLSYDVTAVPEPTTWSLLGTAVVAGLFWRRRRAGLRE